MPIRNIGSWLILGMTLAAIPPAMQTAHASQEEDCVAAVFGMLQRTDSVSNGVDGQLARRQLRDLLHGKLRWSLGDRAFVTSETFRVGTAWEWADESSVSDGTPLEPGVDWRVARTPPVDTFSGGITVLGDGLIDPETVRGRAVVMWQQGPPDLERADPDGHNAGLRRTLEAAGATALLIVQRTSHAPNDALPRYFVRDWDTAGSMPALFISRRVFARWMSSEGHSAADAFTGRAPLPLHLAREVSGSIALQGESTRVHHVVAEFPGVGSLADERVFLLTDASWFSFQDHELTKSPDRGASGLATGLCAAQRLSARGDRRALTFVVGVGTADSLAFLPDSQVRNTYAIVSLTETGRLATQGLQVTPFDSERWPSRLDAATRPSNISWSTARHAHWKGNPAFPTPSVPSVLMGTGSPFGRGDDGLDIDGVRTLTEVTAALLTELLTEPDVTPETRTAD